MPMQQVLWGGQMGVIQELLTDLGTGIGQRAGELASLILCIHVLLLHVNRSILHSSHSVAE